MSLKSESSSWSPHVGVLKLKSSSRSPQSESSLQIRVQVLSPSPQSKPKLFTEAFRIVPVFFHNQGEYDAHLILHNLGKMEGINKPELIAKRAVPGPPSGPPGPSRKLQQLISLSGHLRRVHLKRQRIPIKEPRIRINVNNNALPIEMLACVRHLLE